MISPFEVLRESADAVGEQLAVTIESCVRRGSDVVIAEVLGAKAVMIGRAALCGLATGGEAEVARAFHLLQEETYRVLGKIGCNAISGAGTQFMRYDRLRR